MESFAQTLRNWKLVDHWRGNQVHLKNRKQVWEIIELQEGRKRWWWWSSSSEEEERTKQREGGVTSSERERRRILAQTPTDSEEKKPVHQFIQRGETKKETKKGRKEGRKSHPIEETETLCDFQITKTPATNRGPPKREHYGNNEIIL